jgi:hypothetical protein
MQHHPQGVHHINVDMIYFSTVIGLTPIGSGTVHIYTQTIHRTTQQNNMNNKKKKNNKFGRVLAMPSLLP